ncbi:hypothetical protein SKAU_G00326510 [Synaphobranchus kaupii]|uniref:Peptidase A2 domain-containing protein n=1 Tax=Synaphobranchus kaupii TaxID=118154 RepID=A0A9Q1EPX8_SYNKA|nr:hypothetical protein SKAU_G00326510 [Synaphobranchus kaupii]
MHIYCNLWLDDYLDHAAAFIFWNMASIVFLISLVAREYTIGFRQAGRHEAIDKPSILTFRSTMDKKRSMMNTAIIGKHCTCRVGGASIPLLIDTGAKVSLLNKVTYGRYFSHVPLDVAANSLSGYGQRFRQHNVTLNAEKCVFGAEEVEFLGFRLSRAGITLIMSHTEAILSLPDPRSPSQLSSFLGMATYYLRFLPHYSDATAPLRQPLCKDAVWDWTPACQEAVRAIKWQLTSPPTLAHFSLTAPTLVTCDASVVELGAVLSQVHEGVERPVAFASRALTLAEQKYSVGDREALACLWACEHWHVCLYGRAFTI